jgi:hypothetical protein
MESLLRCHITVDDLLALVKPLHCDEEVDGEPCPLSLPASVLCLFGEFGPRGILLQGCVFAYLERRCRNSFGWNRV